MKAGARVTARSSVHIGAAQVEADRAEIRRLARMSDREREAYFLATNRNMLRLLADADERHDPDPRSITDQLDQGPGAWDDALTAEEDIKAGRFIPLEDL